MGFVEELKRRNVVRVGIAYAVTAWLVLQVADLVIEHIEAPGWVMDVLFLLVVLGFLVSLAVAWVYEVTPEGIKRERDVARDESVTQQTARRLDIVTLVAVGGLLALFAWDRLGDGEVSPPVATVIDDGRMDTATIEAVDDPTVEGAGETGTAPSTDIVPGIAVLPFESLSAEPADAYFAGGIHEDVLTHLAGIGDLRIISRTSMERIAERGLAIPELAGQLGVSHVLEGSVRRDGDRVRVTVQLIDAASDDHVWAENYDRTLDDIFAIQTEIAVAIATQLEAELSPAERARLAEIPTISLEAYDLYLQAVDIGRRGASTRHDQQADLLEQAVALDPDFVDALAGLADAYARLVFTRMGPDDRYRERAERMVERIESGWPGSVEARLARADFHYAALRDFEGALARYLDIEPERPNDPELLLNIASSYKRLGRYDEGLVYLDKALRIDPERPTLYSERAIQQAGAGRFGEILPGLHDAAARFPESELIQSWIGHYAFLLDGDRSAYVDLLVDDDGGFSVSRYAIESLGETFVFRLAAEEFGTDTVIADMDELRDAEDHWMDLLVDGQAAELLLITGRADEARALAREALAAARVEVVEPGRLPGNEPREKYAQLAYVACMADDAAAADEFRALAGATEPNNPRFSATDRLALVMAQAACGDSEGAWKALPEAQAPWLNFSDWSLVLDPAMRFHFGDLPEYRAHVESVQAGRPDSINPR
jgi:TolB-like protein